MAKQLPGESGLWHPFQESGAESGSRSARLGDVEPVESDRSAGHGETASQVWQ